jgi:hypothetical protein
MVEEELGVALSCATVECHAFEDAQGMVDRVGASQVSIDQNSMPITTTPSAHSIARHSTAQHTRCLFRFLGTDE